MKVFYATACFVSTLIGLSVCMSARRLNWFEAQMECRKRNQTLTLQQNMSDKEYWTGFYKKTSHWIKILGCYNDSALQYELFNISLSRSSPGICQEKCLEKDSSLFALQAEKCVCLSDDFKYSTHQLPPSACSNTCNNSNSMLLSTECGGKSAYTVFSSDLKSNWRIKSHCLSLECNGQLQFADIHCNQHLKAICSQIDTGFNNWTECMGQCKRNGSYLEGNIDLSNVTAACTGLDNKDQRWLGVVRDQYGKVDKGEVIEANASTFFNACKKCVVKRDGSECTYVNCNSKLNHGLFCNESMMNVSTLPDVTDIGFSTTLQSVSTMDYSSMTEMHTDTQQPDTTGDSIYSKNSCITYTTNTNIRAELQEGSAVLPLVIPVVLVVVLATCAVVIFLFIRRKRRLEDKDTRSAKKSTTGNNECYSNIDNNINKNYFVLQKHNPSYELAADLTIPSKKVESPYNDPEEGTYDHLGGKDARKEPVTEDTYNHASSVRSPDLSDYDVANNKQVLEEDNDYDHASPAENSYGLFDTTLPKQETDYSELF